MCILHISACLSSSKKDRHGLLSIEVQCRQGRSRGCDLDARGHTIICCGISSGEIGSHFFLENEIANFIKLEIGSHFFLDNAISNFIKLACVKYTHRKIYVSSRTDSQQSGHVLCSQCVAICSEFRYVLILPSYIHSQMCGYSSRIFPLRSALKDDLAGLLN